MPRRLALRVAGVATFIGYALGAPTATAQTREVESRLAISVGAATTDNLGRLPDDDRHYESFATTGIDIGILRESPRARAYVDGLVDYYAYNSEDFRNETAGAIEAGLALHIVPETFSWDFEERIDHTRLDPFAPAGPGNTERTNLFLTGPRATIPLGDSATLGMIGQLSERRYRDTESLNGPTRSISLRIARDLDELQRFGFVVSEQDMRFDDPAELPYKIQEAYLTYERSAAAEGSLEISGGTTRLNREEESDSGPYFQVAWARDITQRSAFSVDGGQRLESPADAFDVGALEGYEAGGVGETLLTGDPRLTRDLRLTYTLIRPRSVITAVREQVREKYDSDTVEDREYRRATIGMDYRFTPLLRGDLEFTSGDEDFELSGTAEERRARASLQRRLGTSWEGSLTFEYNRREYDLGDSYKERRYILSLLWSPVRPERDRDRDEERER